MAKLLAIHSTEQMLECVGCTRRQLYHWDSLGLFGPKTSRSGYPTQWKPRHALRAMIVHELRAMGIPLDWCATAIGAIPPGAMADRILVIWRTDDGVAIRWTTLDDNPIVVPVASVTVLIGPLVLRYHSYRTSKKPKEHEKWQN